ncbi:hypothetical protein KJ664_01210 [Patescibacteria group bacterium]|nr:hypothetical protein [Patescibacteria group bacterium]
MENQINIGDQNAQQTGQNPVNQHVQIPEKSKINYWMISTIILVIVVLLGGFYILNLNKQKVENDNFIRPPEQPTITSIPTITPQPKQEDTTKLKSCVNSSLKLSMKIPLQWSCESKEYWISLKSNLFDINISNLGRGPYCGDGPEPANTNDSCRTSEFYSSYKVAMTMFASYGEDKEIWGFVKNTMNQNEPSTWISVKYQGMEKIRLSDTDKNELIKVMESIEIVK